jgi:hypothetical protein
MCNFFNFFKETFKKFSMINLFFFRKILFKSQSELDPEHRRGQTTGRKSLDAGKPKLHRIEELKYLKV